MEVEGIQYRFRYTQVCNGSHFRVNYFEISLKNLRILRIVGSKSLKSDSAIKNDLLMRSTSMWADLI